MPFQIIRNDITKVRADAIVNTANPQPVIGTGTDQAIYEAAGREQLLVERQKIGYIQPGEAAVTGAFALPAGYIIHTVGPVWQGGDHHEFRTLASCYRKSLLLARQLGCRSIAFPLISTGNYGFPKDQALSVALKTIEEFLSTSGTDSADGSEMEVLLVIFDREAFQLSEARMESVRQYIDENLVEARRREEYARRASELQRREGYFRNASQAPRREEYKGKTPKLPRGKRRRSLKEVLENAPEREKDRPKHSYMILDDELPPYHRESDEAAQSYSADALEEAFGPELDALPSFASSAAPQSTLEQRLAAKGETFQDRLLHLIDERGYTDVQVYKRANIDRKLFSKIRCNPDYTPKKKTALALAIALELDLEETEDLISRAGVALSPSRTDDLIVKYCIENHIYDIYQINALLFQYDEPLLGY